MKVYCGTDIIEVDRIKQAILRTPKFKENIFTPSEISYAESKGDVTKYQHYAGRFAAKEAIYKSLSSLYPHISLNEIEILNDLDNLNRPVVSVHNKDFLTAKLNIQIDVSISHIKDTACANAIVLVL